MALISRSDSICFRIQENLNRKLNFGALSKCHLLTGLDMKEIAECKIAAKDWNLNGPRDSIRLLERFALLLLFNMIGAIGELSLPK